MTDGSRPVLAARRAANCCWSGVSWLWAPAGRVAPPVAPAAERPLAVRPVADESEAAPITPEVCWAWASALAKLPELELPAAAVPVALGVAEEPDTDGSKAV